MVSSVGGPTKSPTWVLAIPATPSIGEVTCVQSRLSLAPSTAAWAACTAAALAWVV